MATNLQFLKNCVALTAGTTSSASCDVNSPSLDNVLYLFNPADALDVTTTDCSAATGSKLALSAITPKAPLTKVNMYTVTASNADDGLKFMTKDASDVKADGKRTSEATLDITITANSEEVRCFLNSLQSGGDYGVVLNNCGRYEMVLTEPTCKGGSFQFGFLRLSEVVRDASISGSKYTLKFESPKRKTSAYPLTATATTTIMAAANIVA